MLPETLKELREERGMKQAQITIILGVNQNTYSNWENGTRNPSLEMLVKIKAREPVPQILKAKAAHR